MNFRGILDDIFEFHSSSVLIWFDIFSLSGQTPIVQLNSVNNTDELVLIWFFTPFFASIRQTGERRPSHERTGCPRTVLPLLLSSVAVENRRQTGVPASGTDVHFCRRERSQTDNLPIGTGGMAVHRQGERESRSVLHPYFQAQQNSLHVHQVSRFYSSKSVKLSIFNLIQNDQVHTQRPLHDFVLSRKCGRPGSDEQFLHGSGFAN